MGTNCTSRRLRRRHWPPFPGYQSCLIHKRGLVWGQIARLEDFADDIGLTFLGYQSCLIHKRGLVWGQTAHLEDFADNFGLLSRVISPASFIKGHPRKNKVDSPAETVGLKIQPTKTILVKLNTYNTRTTIARGFQ